MTQEVTYYWSYPLVLSSLARENGRRALSHLLLPRKKIMHELREAARLGAHTVNVIGGIELALVPDVVRTLRYYGLRDYLDYVRMVCGCIGENSESAPLLPEWSLGALSFAEMKLLRNCILSWNVSLCCSGSGNGNQGDGRLQRTHNALEQRLQSLAYAGRAKIPTSVKAHFGENTPLSEMRQTLSVISTLHRRYGHVQCVGLVSEERESARPGARFHNGGSMLPATARVAREILPDDVGVQASQVRELSLVESLVEQGVSDLGAFSLGNGHRDGDKTFIGALEAHLNARGIALRERLPIFERYILQGWFPAAYKRILAALLRHHSVLKTSS